MTSTETSVVDVSELTPIRAVPPSARGVGLAGEASEAVPKAHAPFPKSVPVVGLQPRSSVSVVPRLHAIRTGARRAKRSEERMPER